MTDIVEIDKVDLIEQAVTGLVSGQFMSPALRSHYRLVEFSPVADIARPRPDFEDRPLGRIRCLVERQGMERSLACAMGTSDDMCECPDGTPDAWEYGPTDWYSMNVTALVHDQGATSEDAGMVEETSHHQASRDEDLEILNGFLTCELAAAHGYAKVLSHLADDACAADLDECRVSHLIRGKLLRDLIISLGGFPADGVTEQEAIAAFCETETQWSGKSSELAVLAGREEALRAIYLADVGELGEGCRGLVRQVVAHEQHRTNALMRRMARWIADDAKPRSVDG